MKIARTALAGILALFAAATASAQQFPTVPAHTVVGRIGIPGDTGPSQAIPFANFVAQMLIANGVPNTALAQMPAASIKCNPLAITANTQDCVIQGLVARGAPDANNDKLLIYDNAGGTLKYVTPGLIASAATSGVSSFGGLTGALTAGAGLSCASTTCGVTAGVDINALNPISTNYSIQASDAGKTVWATGGLFTITLPAVGTISGTAPTFSTLICNGDPNTVAGRAKRLSGFPDPIFARLWMNQCVGMKIVNGNWVATVKPGRFRPTFQPTFFIDNGGSDANDGFISNVAGNALQHIAQCVAIVYNELDLTEGLYPICSPTGAQIFAESVTLTNSIPYGLLIYFNGNGGNPIWRPTVGTGTFPLFLSDYGVAILNSITLDCTGGGHPCNCVALHQYTILDLSDTNMKCIGANGSDIGFDCDAQCRINISLGLNVQGTFQSLFRLRYGSQAQFLNTLNAVSSPSLVNLVEAYSQSSLVFQGNFLTGGSWGTMRQYYVLGNSLVTNLSGTTIPGSNAGVSSGVAGAVNGGVCTVQC